MVKILFMMLLWVFYLGYKYFSDNMVGIWMFFVFINFIQKEENKILVQVQLNIYRFCLCGIFLIVLVLLFGGV